MEDPFKPTPLRPISRLTGTPDRSGFYPAAMRTEDGASFYGVREGKLRELFRMDLPWEPLAVVHDRGGGCTLVETHNLRTAERTATVADEHGRILDTLPLALGSGGQRVFLEGGRVLLDGLCRDYRARKTLWDLGADGRRDSLDTVRPLPGGGVFFQRHIWNDGDAAPGRLLCLADRDGRITAARPFPEEGALWGAVPVGEEILLRFNRPGRLLRVDREFSELWRLDLPDGDNGAVDPEAGLGFFTVYFNALAAVDLRDRRVAALRRFPANRQTDLLGVLPGGRAVLASGNEVLILDAALTTLSAFRVTGRFPRLTREGDRTFLLTRTLTTPREIFTPEDRAKLRPGSLRLYEL